MLCTDEIIPMLVGSTLHLFTIDHNHISTYTTPIDLPRPVVFGNSEVLCYASSRSLCIMSPMDSDSTQDDRHYTPCGGIELALACPTITDIGVWSVSSSILLTSYGVAILHPNRTLNIMNITIDSLTRTLEHKTLTQLDLKRCAVGCLKDGILVVRDGGGMVIYPENIGISGLNAHCRLYRLKWRGSRVSVCGTTRNFTVAVARRVMVTIIQSTDYVVTKCSKFEVYGRIRNIECMGPVVLVFEGSSNVTLRDNTGNMLLRRGPFVKVASISSATVLAWVCVKLSGKAVVVGCRVGECVDMMYVKLEGKIAIPAVTNMNHAMSMIP